MSGQKSEIRLGVLAASPDQLSRIEAWVAAFSRVKAQVEPVTEIGLERYDLFLVVLDGDPEIDTATYFNGSASTPCIVLATRDESRFVDAALAAGATDFLAMPTLDAEAMERAVLFSLSRQRRQESLVAREGYLVAARERDRQRLANALHDGPLQDLIGARFLLSALAADGPVDDIQDSLQSVIQTIRSLCSDLKPPALSPFGLEKAIRAHMKNFQARQSDITVTLELDVDNQQLPEWARMALFRIFQAAVSNVARHAEASQLGVRLRLDEDDVRLSIADDGQGFTLPQSWLDFARSERFGLLMMQERADALHGRMMVQSDLGSGTRVVVQAPLHQPSQPLPTFLHSTEPE